MSMPISEDRADRIESKVDALISAVNRLAVIDERQVHAGIRMGHLEDKVAKAEEKLQGLKENVEKWINRSVGMWTLVILLFTLYQAFAHKMQ